MIVMNTESYPWSEWAEPRLLVRELASLSVQPVTEKANSSFDIFTKENGADVRVGNVLPEALTELGRIIGFPGDFICEKLDPKIGAACVNDRIRQASTKPWGLCIDGRDGNQTVTMLQAGWRDCPSAKLVASTAWEAAVGLGNGMTIHEASQNQLTGETTLVIKTPHIQPITPKEGDVLQAIITVRQIPYHGLSVSADALRLWCSNGASEEVEWSWKKPSESSIEHQLEFVRQQVIGTANRFDNMVERARNMAQTLVEGDPQQALYARLRAMRVPRRYWEEVWEAYQIEPGMTEWDMLNAITRFATHSPELTTAQSRTYQRGAGNWVGEFELVTARLPRPVAMSTGAHIM